MHYVRTGILVILAFYFFFYLVGGAQAAPIDDIPQAVQDGLFGGGDSGTAKLFLSGAILASIGLALSVSKVNFFGTAIVLLATAGVLTGMGWLSAWLLVLAGLIVAGFWAKEASIWIGG